MTKKTGMKHLLKSLLTAVLILFMGLTIAVIWIYQPNQWLSAAVGVIFLSLSFSIVYHMFEDLEELDNEI